MKLDDPNETKKYSSLGKTLCWFTQAKNANKLFIGLGTLCLLLFLTDFTYHKHVHFPVEEFAGFYGVYGFVMFNALILVAKALRLFIKRPEDYYGNKAIDTEEFPTDQLEQGSK